ncbi:MAG: hypothetical protein IPJ48_19185 [Propionivibrio sp.]|uniref:Flagellar protein FliT n=1 Tax=Candidatus Propionivibrio dominans TaxID=2954373 RepID=A0A9D7FH24_9RHOO|nr:hypothetical protein [Candidatus Propionivibrio dominans]
MEIERQYLAALDLTHQMVIAAGTQDWETLTGLEKLRAERIAATPSIASLTSSLEPALARRIAAIITEIERENVEILEQIQAWQKHARILLRLDKSEPLPERQQ